MGHSGQKAPAILERIVYLRGRKVVLSSDLAELYGVTHKRLKEQVRRNPERFPRDFMFVLTNQELAILKPQFAASRWGGSRKPPLAFTEHGAVMAANVLNSVRAIQMSLFVVRAFIQLREAISANKELAQRLDELERRIDGRLVAHDQTIREILEAIRRLVLPPDPQRQRQIGFVHS